MILLANGCSWTWGAGLEESFREESVYAALIAKKINRKLVNLSVGCASNQRILRTTFNWLSKQNKDIWRSTIAIIQWTDESRYEYYVPDVKKSEDDNWARININVALSPNEDYDRSHERIKYRLETFTELEAAHHMLAYTSAMSYIFQCYGIQHYFWSPSYGGLPYPRKVKDFIDQNQKWMQILGTYERVSKTDSHPSVKGHKEIAEQILNFVK